MLKSSEQNFARHFFLFLVAKNPRQPEQPTGSNRAFPCACRFLHFCIPPGFCVLQKWDDGGGGLTISMVRDFGRDGVIQSQRRLESTGAAVGVVLRQKLYPGRGLKSPWVYLW